MQFWYYLKSNSNQIGFHGERVRFFYWISIIGGLEPIDFSNM